MSTKRYTSNSEATLTAENTFCDPVICEGEFNVRVRGTFVGTITVQRSDDYDTLGGSANWIDEDTLTVAGSLLGKEPESKVYYRAGFKTGEYTSGTAYVRVSR